MKSWSIGIEIVVRIIRYPISKRPKTDLVI